MIRAITEDLEVPENFFQNANVTEAELKNLQNDIKALDKKVNISSMSEAEVESFFHSYSVYNVSNSLSTDADCEDFLRKRGDIEEDYVWATAFCVAASCLGGGPLVGCVCVTAATVHFSKSMRRLERDNPDCAHLNY